MPSDKKLVNIRIDPDQWDFWHDAAISKGVSLTNMIIDAVDRRLRAEGEIFGPGEGEMCVHRLVECRKCRTGR